MQSPKVLAVIAATVLLPACATLPPDTQRDPRDRFERFNRTVYKVNDSLDRHIARPVAVAYVKVTPQPVRTGVGNFFANLGYTTVVVNDLLQGKLRQFAADTTRLVVNTTIGIAGLFDPASSLGLEPHDEDFGQTLGKWGVPTGPFLMLPVLGPSTVRDGVGRIADRATEPETYLVHSWEGQLALATGSLLDTRASLLGTDQLLQDSFDPYAFMRNAYLQRREFQVKDGAASPEPEFEIYEDEDTDDSGAASGEKAGQPAPVDVSAAEDDPDAQPAQAPGQ